MDRRSIVWQSADGLTTQTQVGTALGASTIQSALLGVSNADILSWWEGTWTINPTPSPMAAPFQSVRDLVDLLFSTTGTGLLSVTLPAPLQAIFYSDLETVNPGMIAGLIAAIVGTAKTQSGDTATAYVSGRRKPR